MTNKTKPSSVDVLDEILHHAALADADRGASTPADHAWSRQLGASIDARLAELRRSLTPAEAPTEKARPLKPTLLAMARDALISAIERVVQSMPGAVQYAHRNLTGLTDDDLRRLLDALDPNYGSDKE